MTIIEGDEQWTFGQVTEQCSLQATITIHDCRVYAEVAFAGTVGAGEAYHRGLWTCPDLAKLIRIFVLNRDLLDGMDRGLALAIRPFVKIRHWLNQNTKVGSRRNIAAHYDLGNDFFRVMLDETMMYSCAYFERPDATLVEASRAKNDRICRKLHLSSQDHVLEIGTGWGGFALHAASQYGCQVTTVTISQQQYDMAMQRVKTAGLADHVTVLLKDYRDLPKLGHYFDKLVSIEMIEAVGHQNYDSFFEVCGRMLKPNGLMLLQAITIDERFYERARHSVDFIQRFIFPGSCIPSISALTRASSRRSDFGLIHLDDMGAHYAPTLQAWRQNVYSRVPHLASTGYSAEFLRLWEFYLCYCEGGFLERSISAVQMLFAKSGWRSVPVGC